MLIGVPKEIKDQEYRVGATPEMVRTFVEAGHIVKVQSSAGKRIGFFDEMYADAGASIVERPEQVYDSEMIIKVKEPQASEYPLLKEGQILFCYLHLAPDPVQTENLLKSKCVGIAFETVTDASGRNLPLLIPMSEIAGRISIQAGATALQMAYGGKGILMGGVPGVPPAKVVILGGGVAGTQAARVALGLGAHVTILDIDLPRLRQLDSMYGPALTTIYSTTSSIEEYVLQADLLVGAVLIPGKKAPSLVSKEMIKAMSPGSVVVDVAIDQGGCIETSRPTTHTNPTYIVDDVVHYCVANMPGACARSSTEALGHATQSYALKIANLGYNKALRNEPGLRAGLNVWFGEVTNENVAVDLNYEFRCPETVLV
ncbi:MAG: alanine dehydrogenase [Chlamydiales bacterium]|jgi:alanine dehydrogenase